MTVIGRHLSAEFLRLFLFSIAAFLGLFLVVDFFENLWLILKYEANTPEMLLFFGGRLPWMLSQTIPMATLLATVLSLTLLSRHGEITALRCGGVPLRRLVLPYLACGLVLSFANGFIQEIAAPRGFAFAREVKEIRIKGKSPRSLLKTVDVWLRSGPNIVHVGHIVPETSSLQDVTIAELRDARVIRRLDARRAVWQEDGWVLQEVEVRTFDEHGVPRTQRLSLLPYPLQETPEDFQIEDIEPEEASWADLNNRLERYRAQGLETRDLEVGLWSKTSVPFVNLIMPLLAFPFGIRAGRRGSTSVGIVLAILLGFGYWLLLAVGLSLGKADVLPPPAAAWVGNLVFGVLGIALLIRAERHA